jgi:hypothetical protein
MQNMKYHQKRKSSLSHPDFAFQILLRDGTNIFHKNREISILTIKKKTARLTLLQEATERTSQGETQNKTKHEKHKAV